MRLASPGLFVVDLTWVGDLTGWALTASRCGSGLCPGLATTMDGGQTWERLASPPAFIQDGTINCGGVACVSHVRFATTTLGYLYGPALLVTNDGGHSWQPEGGLPVEALEPTSAGVYRIVYDRGGCPGPCDRTVQVAPAGSRTWRTVLTIPFNFTVPSHQDTAQLVPQAGQDVYIPIYGDIAAGGGTQEALLFRSLDAGHTWHQLGDPCAGGGNGSVATDFAASAGGFAAALCFPRGATGGSGEFVVTSSTAGASWGPPHPVPGSSSLLIAAASPTHLVVATPAIIGSGPVTDTLYVSTDGAAHWALAVSDPGVLDPAAPGSAFLGFEDSLVGRWVGSHGAIWTTRDGGVHWSKRLFQ